MFKVVIFTFLYSINPAAILASHCCRIAVTKFDQGQLESGWKSPFLQSIGQLTQNELWAISWDGPMR